MFWHSHGGGAGAGGIDLGTCVVQSGLADELVQMRGSSTQPVRNPSEKTLTVCP